jgi:hypothetical protein
MKVNKYRRLKQYLIVLHNNRRPNEDSYFTTGHFPSTETYRLTR